MNKHKKIKVVTPEPPVEDILSGAKFQDVQISKIVVERNPRKRFDEERLDELASSIKERGLQQPIVLEPGKDDTFVLVSGERRLRAHKKLKKTTIKAIIRNRTNHDGRERFLDAVIENDQRAEMTPIELGHAYRTLWDQFDMSTRDISKRTGRREGFIQDHLRLTDLDPEIQNMIEMGFWKDSRLVRLLLKISDKDVRIELARHLFKNKVSLKGSLKAVERTFSMMAMKNGKLKDFREGTPAFKILDIKEPLNEAPRRWGLLSQLGHIPQWSLVVHSAEETCNLCPLRSMASVSTCKDCGAVQFLRSMMETAK